MITKVEVFSARPAPILSLGGFMPSDDPVHIRDISGLGPVKAEITTTPSGASRGATFQGVSTDKRNIVLTLGLSPNWSTQTVSSLRQLLYAYFMTEQWCKLRFHSDELPTTDIEGYVEGFEPNHFAQDPEYQISIINPRPDFIEIDASIYEGLDKRRNRAARDQLRGFCICRSRDPGGSYRRPARIFWPGGHLGREFQRGPSHHSRSGDDRHGEVVQDELGARAEACPDRITHRRGDRQHAQEQERYLAHARTGRESRHGHGRYSGASLDVGLLQPVRWSV